MRPRCLAPALLLALATTAQARQGFAPDEAPGRMTVADGLRIRLVACEPLVRQPVAIDFDDRGRPWVLQYLQYPNPEGLRRTQVDRYSRTRYDRIPDPPPRGPRGNDRLTILEDTDGDGRMDRAVDFLSGLNLASGFAFGDGGVYVLNVPYLLFYPDRDRDDVPDSDPEVLLSGFGMEDAHSVANSLTWGPDGWLYGLQGSTVTANIRGNTFQQGVWRYHPRTRRFELFAEGGGNMWGLDFDRYGRLLASTNVGGNVLLHFVQGGYYWKQFGKHGPLHNPFAFGHFDHVPHEGVSGGHVAVGGLVYEADAWPAHYRGAYLAADLLDHSAHIHRLEPHGSTLKAHQEGDLLRANDTWFAPSDMTLGPDGHVYLADWHDRRTAHPDPDADWDRSNGRIYRIEPVDAQIIHEPFDLTRLSTTELVQRLDHPNTWHARRARRLLAERRDPASYTPLRRRVTADDGPGALGAMWALYSSGGWDDELAARLLEHPDEHVRAWTVRLIGDAPASETLQARLADLARDEPSVVVRAQLASTARRLPPEPARTIIAAIAERDIDDGDPFLPLLLWWALEHHVASDRAAACRLLTAPDLALSELARNVLRPRLVRRLAAEATPEGDAACRALLESLSLPDQIELLTPLSDGLRGRPSDTIAPGLVECIARLHRERPDDPEPLRLAAALGVPAARQKALVLAADTHQPGPSRVDLIEALSQSDAPELVRPLINLAVGDPDPAVATAALRALGVSDTPEVPEVLLSAYSRKDVAWRSEMRSLLLARKSWARAILAAVDRGAIDAGEFPLEQVSRVASLRDPDLDAIVRRHWGWLNGPAPEEKLAEVRRLQNDLRTGPGDAVAGRLLFREHCATCHRLFGEGEPVGPELTFANRQDREFLLLSLVDPSNVVRREFQASIVATRDGRVLTGLIAEDSPAQLTLVDPRGERVSIPRAEIERIDDAPASLMPEGLYRLFSPQQLRDLFAYLQSAGPVQR